MAERLSTLPRPPQVLTRNGPKPSVGAIGAVGPWRSPHRNFDKGQGRHPKADGHLDDELPGWKLQLSEVQQQVGGVEENHCGKPDPKSCRPGAVARVPANGTL